MLEAELIEITYFAGACVALMITLVISSKW